MKSTKLPSISIVIPCYNEEENLLRLLSSIKKTSYPKNKLEVLVVDDDSTDKTVAIAKQHGATVISVKTHDIELNKGIGMHAATKDLVYWLDADMELLDTDFFEKMVKPFEDTKIIAAFTKEYALDKGPRTDNSLLRFISYDPLQCDPLYQYFSTSIDETIVENSQKGYAVCKFYPGNIPPCGRSMYRRKELLETTVGSNKAFIDLESLEIVVRAGKDFFAYVPSARLRHYHATSLGGLIKERLRNLERDYLPNIEQKYFVWFDASSVRGKLKIIGWILYANLFFPELVRGIVKGIQHRDSAFLWQPFVSLFTTDAILWGFISKPVGRKMIFRFLLPF